MLVQMTISVDDDACLEDIKHKLVSILNTGYYREYIEMTTDQKVSVASVITATSKITGVAESEIKSKRRTAPIVTARMKTYYVAVKMCNFGYSRLGALLDLDHTTIIHGVRRIEKKSKADAVLRAELQAIFELAKEVDHDRFETLKEQNKCVYADPEERRALRPVPPQARPYLSVKPLPIIRRDSAGNLISAQG